MVPFSNIERHHKTPANNPQNGLYIKLQHPKHKQKPSAFTPKNFFCTQRTTSPSEKEHLNPTQNCHT
jgi:hypothetical protein